MSSLRSLTLCLTFHDPQQWGLADSDLQGVSLHHHCCFISRFPELLPAIEHLDFTVPCLCSEAFTGTTRPQARDGTFILTISPQLCVPCSAGDRESLSEVNTGAQVLQRMHASQDKFSEMKDWDVRICSDEFGFPFRPYGGESFFSSTSWELHSFFTQRAYRRVW